MKIYKDETLVVKKVSTIKCNCCGNEIPSDKFGYTSDYLSITKKWGYNSDFDNEKHNFDICENCYKEIISKFKIPITID